jgi:hypothetical protein
MKLEAPRRGKPVEAAKRGPARHSRAPAHPRLRMGVRDTAPDGKMGGAKSPGPEGFMSGLRQLVASAALVGLAVSAREPGRPFVLEGRVLGGLDGTQPMRDVRMYFYHAADDGDYHWPRNAPGKPRINGILHTNVMGEYLVRTVLPGTAEGIPHVHIELQAPGTNRRFVTITLARSSGPGSDTTYRRLPYMIHLTNPAWAYVYRDSAGVFRCHYDIHYSGGFSGVREPDDSK